MGICQNLINNLNIGCFLLAVFERIGWGCVESENGYFQCLSVKIVSESVYA